MIIGLHCRIVVDVSNSRLWCIGDRCHVCAAVTVQYRSHAVCRRKEAIGVASHSENAVTSFSCLRSLLSVWCRLCSQVYSYTHSVYGFPSEETKSHSLLIMMIFTSASLPSVDKGPYFSFAC